MEKQLIISVGREFGSAGHVIAEKLAERFQLSLYDSNLLKEIAVEKNLNHEQLKKYDEIPRNRLLSRTVNGYSNSAEENIANMQFEYLKKKADAGESFVVVGRCAESILKSCSGLVSIFILGDMDKKAARIMEQYHVSEDEAKTMIRQQDKKRKTYHNYHCKGKWGDSRNYDLCINSSKLGIDRTVELLECYIRERREI